MTYIRSDTLLLLLYLITLTGVAAELSCPCNLISYTCELSCCCDTDCNDQYKQLAFCIPSSVARDSLPSFLDQFLAISIDNSPYLGLFYPDLSNVSSNQFDSLVPNSLQEQYPSSYTTPLLAYKYGDPVLSLTGKITHYSTYPIPGPHNECIYSPIPYLDDIQISCMSYLPFSLTLPSILSPTTQVSVSPTYLCTSYTEWVSHYTIDNVQGVSLLNTSLFSVCPDTLSSCSNNSCEYAILSSHRVITWLQDGITGIQDEIRLIRLPPDLPVPIIQQEYTLSYESRSNISPLLDSVASEQVTLGYVRGSDLLFATQQETGNFSLSAGSIITSSNGYCSAVTPKSIQFMDSVYSGCSLTLSHNFNCTNINKDLMQLIQALINVTHVARSRRASNTNPDHWIPIIKSVIPPNSSLCYLPSRISMRFLYSETGAVDSYRILEIVGAGVDVEYTRVPDLQLVIINGVWTVPISTSVEFILVPTVSVPPSPRSYLIHPPVCREPCYDSYQLFYPLYQSMYLQDVQLSSSIDGLYFSVLLSITLALVLYRIVSVFSY